MRTAITAIPIHAKRQIKHALTALAGLALVAEGGGPRGVFTAGVLDSWQIARFNPFSILVGTSARAQNIASYVSEQHGYAYSLMTDLTRTTEFFNPWRLFSDKHIMDLDWYFAQAGNSFYAFDAHQASTNSEGRTVRFSTSQSDSTLMDPD
ncbi:MAG: patatin-like phospholipase family protein [Thalassotalea sp.]|nr:patatin-like phospholipase family protein [Thalassotalea sp.]